MGVHIALCKGAIFGGKDIPGHARPHSAVSCTKMAEPIEMPFGLIVDLSWPNEVCVISGCTLAPPGEYD